MHSLVVNHISVRRAERMVLSDISFGVSSGEVLRLVGHNGSGKTTLIRTIAGLLTAEVGDIRLAGGQDDATVGEQSHLVGHHNAIKPAMTVSENLAFWQRFLDGPADGVARALDVFRLDALADIPAGLLSAGQKRRTGLARLLVADRPIWLLDEPTTSLDTATSDLVVKVIDQHARSGGLAIVATHLAMSFEGARDLALRAGRVVRVGEPSPNSAAEMEAGRS